MLRSETWISEALVEKSQQVSCILMWNYIILQKVFITLMEETKKTLKVCILLVFLFPRELNNLKYKESKKLPKR